MLNSRIRTKWNMRFLESLERLWLGQHLFGNTVIWWCLSCSPSWLTFILFSWNTLVFLLQICIVICSRWRCGLAPLNRANPHAAICMDSASISNISYKCTLEKICTVRVTEQIPIENNGAYRNPSEKLFNRYNNWLFWMTCLPQIGLSVSGFFLNLQNNNVNWLCNLVTMGWWEGCFCQVADLMP